MHPLEAYLGELRVIRASGAAVKELGYYTPLAELLNAIGKKLKPKVRCIQQLKNTGGGNPDFGLFTSDQFEKSSDPKPRSGQIPSRGPGEVKGTGEDIANIVVSEQIAEYLNRYGILLVTNYRDFALIGRDARGKPVTLESYRLATSEAAFWAAVSHPRKTVETHGERFLEYLQRVLTHTAPLSEPKDVAWLLASYAREARVIIEQAGALPALNELRLALERSLGIEFKDEKGEHFFRSTLVQTLFYGIFAAWVLWHNEQPERTNAFDWRVSTFYLHVPVLQTLFHEISNPVKLRDLGLMEILDWAGAALNRVDKGNFFSRFDQGKAVQYFYEPFLEAYDPELRKQLGVWYTPPEIIQYMVARVDQVLRSELGIADGLADPNVYVLDPACGTAGYPLEVLRQIAKTLEEKGDDGLLAYDLKKAAMERVFGFEILSAPFVISHLQIGLLLHQYGAELREQERPAIYLTNALTGWEPPKGPKQLVTFREFEEERDAANRVKQTVPILVILGNPPYNAFSGVAQTEEEKDLIQLYKEGLSEKWGIKKFNLDDLYVRFFRLAERRIVEQTGRGVVCFISNFSYLGDSSFAVMRQRFLEGFDILWFDCMNGDSRETGKLTPDGAPDPSVFSTDSNREGIRVGTTVGLMVRKIQRDPQPTVRFRHFWGTHKRDDLVKSLQAEDFDAQYNLANPQADNRYSFRPTSVSGEYGTWPQLTDLCAEPPSNGLMEKRGGALIDIDPGALEKRMRMYFDPTISWDELCDLRTGLTEDAAGYDAEAVRPKVQKKEKYQSDRLRRYALRPFDTRWCYYSDVSPLWNRSRPSLWNQCVHGNRFIMSRPAGIASPEGFPIFFTTSLGDNDFLRGHAYYFPFRLWGNDGMQSQTSFFEMLPTNQPNISIEAEKYLSSLGIWTVIPRA